MYCGLPYKYGTTAVQKVNKTMNCNQLDLSNRKIKMIPISSNNILNVNGNLKLCSLFSVLRLHNDYLLESNYRLIISLIFKSVIMRL